MIFRFVVLVALLLAGCAGSPPGPSPGTSSAPPPAARIGTLALALDTSGPSIGLGLACTEEVPPVCEGATPWKTFDRPGTEGRACIDPGPNPCWSADGSFHFASVNPGYPIISAQTFQGKLSLEADISATCTDPGCFAGPAIYSGEAMYRAVYLVWGPAGIEAHLYAPRFTVPLSSAIYTPGSKHTLAVEYDAGNWIYKVDGATLLVERADAPLGIDTPILEFPPHAALFVGLAHGDVSRFDMFAAP